MPALYRSKAEAPFGEQAARITAMTKAEECDKNQKPSQVREGF
jgi:hypothetical protein